VSEVEIWRVPLDAPTDVVQRLYVTLSSDERERADRYATELLAARFIAGRGALRALLAARVGCAPASLLFEYGPAGKPSAAGHPIVFNVSHSGALAVIAISDSAHLALGIDVEELRPVSDLHDIACYFFAPGERDDLAAVEAPLQSKAFLNCWTRKEAYLKAVGNGLLAPLDRFEVTLRPSHPPVFRHIDGDAAAAAAWHIHHFALPEHVAALVVNSEVNVKPWRLLDLTTPCRQRRRRFDLASDDQR